MRLWRTKRVDVELAGGMLHVWLGRRGWHFWWGRHAFHPGQRFGCERDWEET